MEERKLLKRRERARETGKLDDWETCCEKLGEFYVSCGRYEDALEAFKELLSVCEMKGDCSKIAQAQRMMGEMYNNLGQFTESLDYTLRYLDFARKSRDTVEEQRAQATLGRTYFCWAAELKATDSVKASSIIKDSRKAFERSLYICENDLVNIDHRERQEMKARVLYNLGLLHELQENLDEAIRYVEKSIAISKEENLFDDLHRSYLNLGSMLMKKNQSSLALSVLEKAVQVSKKLPNSVEALVLALLQKADVYFSMGDYRAARVVLKEAYRAKTPNEDDRRSVGISLKRAIELCNIEGKLEEAVDISEKKILYEKLGDACVSVKNFSHAIRCYKNMLDCALSLGLSGKKLQPCYVSLYQTYMDEKEYDLALEYARKEFELCKNIPEEAAKSHLVIGEILEKKSDYYAVIDEYQRAKKIGEEIGDAKIVARALKRIIAVQKNDGRSAAKAEEELEKIQVEDSDDCQSEEEEEFELADLSDSEEERLRTRSARNTFRVSRNEKGETQLHVAAIKGDLAKVERLISLGHPVKERDLAGWTPLHEAANHGHQEIVELLIKAGADVNDRGGKECGGITPLHDAATCGNFDVIKTLLEHKASVTVLTDEGETPLDCLRAWRNRVELDEDEEAIYKEIAAEFDSRLKSAGFQPHKEIKTKRPEKENRKREVSLRHGLGDRRRQIWKPVSPLRNSQRSPDLEILDSPRKKSPGKSVADYRATMNALRKRPVHSTSVETSHEKAPLLDANSYIDEWLEDDLRQNTGQKKRRLTDFFERDSVRKPRDGRNPECPPENPAEKISKKPRLQDFSPPPDECIGLITPPRTEESLEFLHLTSPPLSSVSMRQTFEKIRLQVGKITLLIPVDSTKVNELNVQWLLDEASVRYCDIEGAEPKLQLKTKDSAVISLKDPISVIFGEDLNCSIIGWKNSNLADRYKDAVARDDPPLPMSQYGAYIRGPDLDVVQRLSSASKWIDLSYLTLTVVELKPVFQALKHETGIEMLNLAGNVLTDSGLVMLMEYLENCTVKKLNLRCNNITLKGLSTFVNSLSGMSREFRDSLGTLDFSYNPIGPISSVLMDSLKFKLPNLTHFITDHCEIPK